MCGIFGISIEASVGVDAKDLKKLTKMFFQMSERRGKDASGFVSIHNYVEIIKSPHSASTLIQDSKFKNIFQNAISNYKNGNSFTISGHTRMVTSGSEYNNNNNQPIIKDNNLLIHNGIIVNEDNIYEQNPKLKKEYEVDSEVMLELYNFNSTSSKSNAAAFKDSINSMSGANTFILIDPSHNEILLHSSNRSLYIFNHPSIGLTFYCSEEEILNKAIKIISKYPIDLSLASIACPSTLEFFRLDLSTHRLQKFLTYDDDCLNYRNNLQEKKISHHKTKHTPRSNRHLNDVNKINNILDIQEDYISELKRCSKCVLPESFPSITFDKNDICNFCNAYSKNIFLGEKKLFDDAKSWQNYESYNDVLVPLSGGRDSCYGLHYVKKELGLNPVAYTYDWGFITDHARKNISRICGELNVEHIIVAANIRQKRINVRKNVQAWLKKPDISLVPLFMAGDKFFYKYASLLKKEMNLSSIIFSLHALEVTHFKTGFASVKQDSHDDWHQQLYGLSKMNRLKLMLHYLNKFFENPRYFNFTIPDTLAAFYYYYMRNKDYYSIFDYLEWDESLIVNTIKDKYGWQGSSLNGNSWRIGDGTAPFYNYIYLRHSGFSENDTFRSNQIREGLIDREDAMKSIKQDNCIDADTFKWYCDTINIDAIDAIKIINSNFDIKKNSMRKIVL
jgi:glutamine---fructose-6-phosphate transaminase (isomerizing)